MIELLIQHGAYADHAVYQSAINGDQQLTEHLLKNGTFEWIDQNKVLHQALIGAAIGGHITLVDWLIEQGAPVNLEEVPLPEKVTNIRGYQILNQSGYSPIQAAAERGNMEMVKHLHEKGSTLIGVLYGAVSKDHYEIAEYALLNGIDVKDELKKFDELFYKAAANPNPAFVKLLIENGISVNESDELGRSGLRSALAHLNVETAEYLLRHGAELPETGSPYSQYVHIALRNNNLDMVKLLMKYIGNEVLLPQEITDCIFESVKQGYLDQLKFLVNAGGDLHMVYPNNENLVFVAVQYS